MKKRIIGLLFATLMLLSLLPISAMAAGTAHNITNGSPLTDKDKNGGYITVDASAEEGDEVEVGIVPNSGFQLKDLSYTTASSGTFSAVYKSGNYVFTMPADDVTVTATFEKVRILTGENGKWTKGTDDGAWITCSGAYDKFAAAYMDGKLISESSFNAYPALIAVGSNNTESVKGLQGATAGVYVTYEPKDGTRGDRGRQPAQILDDEALLKYPSGGEKYLIGENNAPAGINKALTARIFLLNDFPKEDTQNGDVKIRVRGGGSINAANTPLYIVDGVVADGIKSVPLDEKDGASLIIMINITSRLPEPDNGESNAVEVSAFTGIELKPEYLETLSVGGHILKLVYTDGTEVSTNIEIGEKPVTPTSPQTGDTSNMTVWSMMLALSAAGACTCFVFGKRGKKNKIQ